MARVLYVTDGYSTHDRRFLAQLAECAHEIWYLPCSTDAIRREARLLPAGIHRVTPLNDTKTSPGHVNWIWVALRFCRIVRELQPDILHAGSVQTGAFFAALSGFHPLLVMSWGSDVLRAADESAWMRWIAKFTLRRADMALADCDAVRERIRLLGALADDRIVTFPWGVDPGEFRPKIPTLGLRGKLGWNGCQVIISIRSLELSHGTMIFLDAMRHVIEEQRDVRVLMLGDGSLQRQVKAFIETNHLADKIHLAGQVPEDLLADYLAEADLYVSATGCDGSSVSLLQAMGCGLPVIVADACGNREWVAHRENGWLYPAGDAEQLAKTALEALRDHALRSAMGEANVSIIRARANWNANFGKLLTAYDQLLFRGSATEVKAHAQFCNR